MTLQVSFEHSSETQNAKLCIMPDVQCVCQRALNEYWRRPVGERFSHGAFPALCFPDRQFERDRPL